MAGNLPEKYLEHPLDLIPQLKGSEYIAEVVACCVGLVRVYLLIRASVGFFSQSLPITELIHSYSVKE